MKCPNCEEKKYKKLKRFYKDDVMAYWCIRCGTIYDPSWEDYKKDIPINSKWLSFKNEPPPQDANTELKFLFDSGTCEWIPDIGVHYQDAIITNGRLIDDFGDPVWWCPIGPLPEVPSQNE